MDQENPLKASGTPGQDFWKVTELRGLLAELLLEGGACLGKGGGLTLEEGLYRPPQLLLPSALYCWLPWYDGFPPPGPFDRDTSALELANKGL